MGRADRGDREPARVTDQNIDRQIYFICLSVTKRITLETLNSNNPGEFDAFLEQVMAEGMKQVLAVTAELQAMGVIDAEGHFLTDELPDDMKEESEKDFGG